MARMAHPDAMKPHRAGRTRTAAPQAPAQFPLSGRYLPYTLFGATGVLYLLLGFLALRAVWALGTGPAAWQKVLHDFQHPLYLIFHAISLAAVIFVGVRFFRLFPKAQPAVIGPLEPPPRPVILGALYTLWIVVAGGFALVLAGGIFR